jgi:thiosulfate/3-mercaptopyruvate sulfurtransferase
VNLPGPIVTPAWLSQYLKHPGVAVVDVRWSATGGTVVARREFEDGHIPGAAFADADRDLSSRPFVDGPGRHPLPSPEAFARFMGSIGDDELSFVVYDDVRGSVAARLWWMLWTTGHEVALLDGGLEAWIEDGGHIEKGMMRRRTPSLFRPVPWPRDRIASADAVILTLDAGAAPVLDARAVERYRGEVERLDPVKGHIPGALSAPWTDNLDERGRFKSAHELRAYFEALGVRDDAAIAHCGSGITSCHTLLALRRAGFGDARLYEGSWSDWIRDPSRPVATGPEPGEPPPASLASTTQA